MEGNRSVTVTPMDCFIGNVAVEKSVIEVSSDSIAINLDKPFCSSLELRDINAIFCSSVFETVDLPVNGHYIFILPRKESIESLKLTGDCACFDPESDDQCIKFIMMKLSLDADFLSIFHLMTKNANVSRIKPIEATTRYFMIKNDRLNKRFGSLIDESNTELSDSEIEEDEDTEMVESQEPLNRSASRNISASQNISATVIVSEDGSGDTIANVSVPKVVNWSTGVKYRLDENLVYFGFIECYYRSIELTESGVTFNLLEVDGNVCDICLTLDYESLMMIRVAELMPFWSMTPNEVFAEQVITKFRTLAGQDSVGFGSFYSNSDNKSILIRLQNSTDFPINWNVNKSSVYTLKTSVLTLKRIESILSKVESRKKLVGLSINMEANNIFFGLIQSFNPVVRIDTKKIIVNYNIVDSKHYLVIPLTSLVKVEYVNGAPSLFIYANDSVNQDIMNAPILTYNPEKKDSFTKFKCISIWPQRFKKMAKVIKIFKMYSHIEVVELPKTEHEKQYNILMKIDRI